MNSDFLDLVKKRQSCRSFQKKQSPREVIDSIIEAGRLSPSARNSQPWSFTVVLSEEKVEQVGECTRANSRNAFTTECSAYVIITDEDCSEAFGGLKHRYFAEMDIGMSVMNMCLMAEHSGIASCILGSFDADGVKQIADISKDKEVKLIIALGYASDGYEVREKKRKSYEDIVRVI